MRRIFSFILVTILTISFVKAENWDGITQNLQWYESSTSPYSISTAEELAGLAHLVKSGTTFAGEEIILTNDIDLNGHQWFPIGYYADGSSGRHPFRGIFTTDGDIRTISNFSIDGNEINNSLTKMRSFGLFGYLGDGAEIHNIAIENGTVTAYSDAAAYYLGGLVGYAESKSEGYEGIKITNCSNKSVDLFLNNGSAVTDAYTGGLIGFARRFGNPVSILNCKNEVSISGYNTINKIFIGGIIGLINDGTGNFQMEGCINEGDLSGSALNNIGIGGMIGSFRDSEGNISSIDNCHNKGTVYSSEATSWNYTGGLIGEISCKNTVEIIRCSNIGAIDARGNYLNTGGLIGRIAGNAGMDIQITLSFNHADITANSETNSYTGGIAGHALSGNNTYGSGSLYVNNVYSTSNIYSYSPDNQLHGYAGGLFGSIQIAKQQSGNVVHIENCYATGTIEGNLRYISGIAGQCETDTNSTSRIANCVTYFTSEFVAARTVNRISNAMPNMEYNYGNIPGDYRNNPVGNNGGYWSGKMDKRPFRDDNNTFVWDETIWDFDVDNAERMPKLRAEVFGNASIEQKDITAPGMPDLNDQNRATYNPSAINDIIYSGTKYVINDPISVIYDGNQILIKDSDYTLSEENDWINVGDHGLVFTAVEDGDYVGTYTNPFRIKAKDISDEDEVDLSVLPSNSLIIYNGEEQTLTGLRLTMIYNNINLVENDDYFIEYRNNINAGQAEVVLKGKGNYEGERIIPFTILQKEISDPSVEITTIANQYYTGSAVTPDVIIHDENRLLVKDTDYTLQYVNNTAIGTATIHITGINNYKGSTSTDFQIINRPVNPEPEPDYYSVTVEVIGEGEVDVNGLFYNLAADGSRLDVFTNAAPGYTFGSIFIETGSEDEFEINNGGHFYVSGNTLITVVFYRDGSDPNPDPGNITHNTDITTDKIWTSYGNLHIQSDQAKHVRVISMSGKTVLSRSLPAGETMIAIPGGVYIISLNNQKAIKINVQ